jgi:hypothetical protein
MISSRTVASGRMIAAEYRSMRRHSAVAGANPAASIGIESAAAATNGIALGSS